MDKGYVKDMLVDIMNLANDNDTKGIIAICENEIESIVNSTNEND